MLVVVEHQVLLELVVRDHKLVSLLVVTVVTVLAVEEAEAVVLRLLLVQL